jgi:hypothetical protein
MTTDTLVSETVLQGLNEEFTVSDYAARLAVAFGDQDLNTPSIAFALVLAELERDEHSFATVRAEASSADLSSPGPRSALAVLVRETLDSFDGEFTVMAGMKVEEAIALLPPDKQARARKLMDGRHGHARHVAQLGVVNDDQCPEFGEKARGSATDGIG